MKYNANEVTGICGLFCETCPTFADGECKGCLSDHVAERCLICRPGFRDCVKERGITRCSECNDFPCERLQKFKDCHVVNGISHHEHILDYVRAQREMGVKAWVEEQEKQHLCPECGTMLIWCERTCRGCGKEIKR